MGFFINIKEDKDYNIYEQRFWNWLLFGSVIIVLFLVVMMFSGMGMGGQVEFAHTPLVLIGLFLVVILGFIIIGGKDFKIMMKDTWNMFSYSTLIFQRIDC